MLSILLTASFLKLLEYKKMENGIFMVLCFTNKCKQALSYAKKMGGAMPPPRFQHPFSATFSFFRFCRCYFEDYLDYLDYLGRSFIIVDSF